MDLTLLKPMVSHNGPGQDLQVIRKPFPQDWVAYQVFVGNRAYELSQQSDLFQVPRVVRYNQAKAWIEYEYIQGIQPVLSFCHDDIPYLEMCWNAGRILGLIHNQLQIDPQMRIEIPRSIQARKTHNVYLHGDYNLTNVQYNPLSRKLVVLDWSFTPLFNVYANWGTHLWDIFWMLNSIFIMPQKFLTGKQITQSALAFLLSYNQTSDYKVDMYKLAKYGQRIVWLVFMRNIINHGCRMALSQLPGRANLFLYLSNLKDRSVLHLQ